MSKRAIVADDLLRIQTVGDPQLSPDGKRILFAKKQAGEKNKMVSNLFTVDVETRQVAQWTQGDAGAGCGRWSRDGSTIAFVSGREKPASQIYLLPTTGGEARKLTDLPEGGVGALAWSPDGRHIAFTFRETPTERTQKAAKEREEKGLSSPPWVLEDIFYRMDGDGYFGAQRFKLYTVDVESGKYHLLLDKCKLGMYSFDWLPDSSGLIVSHSAAKNPLIEPPYQQIYHVPLKGKPVRLPGVPKGSFGGVKVSPDGSTVAYLGDTDPKDPWGVRNTKLYVLPVEGGEPRCLTEGDDYCFDAMPLSDCSDLGFTGSVEWTPDGSALIAGVAWHGGVQVARIDVPKGGVELLTQGRHAIGIGNLSRDGRYAACGFGSAIAPNEIGLLEIGKEAPEKLTSFNDALLGELRLSEPREVWLDSTDGVKVQAWVMEPTTATGKKKHPGVLEIHGGPHCMYGWLFFHEFQLLAAQGYLVAFSNPRGSKGYGEAFCAAIRGDWGHKDWEDMRTVVAWLKTLPGVDGARLGVMGGSYGGYMTNWVVGHCRDFTAAITDRCVSNMVSMGGSSDFPFNKDGYFGGYPYGDMEAIKGLWRQSPLASFDKVKTPMLIIHSEGDLRCNIEQSEQVFAALCEQGVEARFVRYPANTSHGMSRSGPPDMRLHRLDEIVRWWDKHLA